MKQKQTVRFETYLRAGCRVGTIIIESRAGGSVRTEVATRDEGLELLRGLVGEGVTTRREVHEARRAIKHSSLPRLSTNVLLEKIMSLQLEVEALRELAQSTAYLAEILANDLGYGRAEDEGEQPPERLN